MSAFSSEEITQWFNACQDDKNRPVVQDFLNRGFEPDTRDKSGKSGLKHAAEGSHPNYTRAITDVLTPRLTYFLQVRLLRQHGIKNSIGKKNRRRQKPGMWSGNRLAGFLNLQVI